MSLATSSEPTAQTGAGPDRIGFYVHHHGYGHVARTLAVLDHLEHPATVLTSLPVDPADLPEGVELLTLPPDTDGDTDDRVATGADAWDATANGALHWVPDAPSLLKPRAALMVGWLTRPDVSTLVCDVSVEAAVLARLCGVGPIVVREHGTRTDAAHRLAYRVGAGVLAPYPAALEPADTPSDVVASTFHAGFISRERTRGRRSIPCGTGPLLVIVVGRGGDSFDPSSLAAIGAELADWTVVLVGTGLAMRVNEQVRVDGWVDDIHPYLLAADVVAGAAGSSLVAEVAAAGRPFVCVPEERPFDEQVARASRLSELGLAVVRPSWPQVGEWTGVVAEAMALGGGPLAALATGATPARAARWIESVSARWSSVAS